MIEVIELRDLAVRMPQPDQGSRVPWALIAAGVGVVGLIGFLIWRRRRKS